MTKEIEIIPCPNEKCLGALTKIYDCEFIDSGVEDEKACMYCCSECLEEFLGTEKIENELAE